MDIYTMNGNFIRQELVDEFVSAIWTERYSTPGDCKLVVPATPEMRTKLAEGTFLSTPGSDEVMLIDTHSVEKGLLTVTGSTLLQFTQERIIRVSAYQEIRNWNVTVDAALVPGNLISTIVNFFCCGGLDGSGDEYGIENLKQKIPGLSLGAIDMSGDPIQVAVPFGSVLEAIKPIADTYGVGMSLYLESADDLGAVLKFKTYKGTDLSGDEYTYPTVEFSEITDTLANVKELSSFAKYKNVAYAFAPAIPTPGTDPIPPGVAYSSPSAASSVGFNRRILMVFADDLTTDTWGGTAEDLTAILTQRAMDGLANNNYTKIVDGEVVPQAGYVFGVDYNLGDIVALKANDGFRQKAMITEFIRSQDATGFRTYPTVSVLAEPAEILSSSSGGTFTS